MRLVLDASIALKWFLNPLTEPGFHKAKVLLEAAHNGHVALAAPPHFFAEVLAVVSRKEPGRIADVQAVLYSLSIDTVSDERVHALAARMSAALKHHMFDTLYQAVAILEAAILVTADEAYFAKSSPLGSVELLSGFKF